MNKIYINYIATSIGKNSWQIENCIKLLEEGATVPFISRYRKEATGSLSDVEVSEINFLYNKFIELDKRKESILNSIVQQEKLTPELEKKIADCTDSQELEDLYLPFRPKRKTRASIAKERGLEPLSMALLSDNLVSLEDEAEKYLNENVNNIEDALSGARDIIAEQISDNVEIRKELRAFYLKSGIVEVNVVKGKEKEGDKYENYFKFSGNLSKIPSHRVLAILRGEQEKILSVKIAVEQPIAHTIINRLQLDGRRFKNRGIYEQIVMAQQDAYSRLLHPSIENECFKIAKEKADLEAVKVFGDNLKQLLLAPPVGQKRTLAIDPGFRTGCKVVVLNENGALVTHGVIYPHPPVNKKMEAISLISEYVEKYEIEAIAIGNGTASRETEAFIKRLPFISGIKIYTVSEDGASIYSASEVAREEFPDYDVTVRGAVSIGRRLMDPLAELVKIDPKSLGVGQYQHDVDQSLLKEKLDDMVANCVNSVGVNLNTASSHLLAYVSGVGAALSKKIVEYRDANGAFKRRKDLLKVPRLGAKVFEQAAGFLRIPNGENVLDNTAVHPERYSLVEKMAKDLNTPISEIIADKEKIEKIPLQNYITEDVGLPTLKDIVQELKKPGRDPRSSAEEFEFSQDIATIEDLKEGMKLPGIVTNITAFGAFVDIGIKQNGLIHISNMADHFISSPMEVLKLHQHIEVEVLSVDIHRERIALKLLK